LSFDCKAHAGPNCHYVEAAAGTFRDSEQATTDPQTVALAKKRTVNENGRENQRNQASFQRPVVVEREQQRPDTQGQDDAR